MSLMDLSLYGARFGANEDGGELDMREHFVIDPLIGKRQQLLLATQLCRMVLKVRHLRSIPHRHEHQLMPHFEQVNQVIIAGSDENDF